MQNTKVKAKVGEDCQVITDRCQMTVLAAALSLAGVLTLSRLGQHHLVVR